MTRIKVIIDRFEGDKAVLLIGDEENQVMWPKKYLPDNAKEGDVLSVQLVVDGEATRAARMEAEQLLRQLLESNKEG